MFGFEGLAQDVIADAAAGAFPNGVDVGEDPVLVGFKLEPAALFEFALQLPFAPAGVAAEEEKGFFFVMHDAREVVSIGSKIESGQDFGFLATH